MKVDIVLKAPADLNEGAGQSQPVRLNCQCVVPEKLRLAWSEPHTTDAIFCLDAEYMPELQFAFYPTSTSASPRPPSLMELGAMPNIRRQVRVRWAESAKFAAWAASVQETPE